MRVVAGEWMELNFGHIPAVRAETCSVYTNRIPSSCKRGIGNIQMNWLMGLVVDELADKLGLDPIDIAVNNFHFEHEPLPNRYMDAVLRAGAERIGWADRHAPGAGSPVDGVKRRGVGVSFNHSWQASWTAAATGGIQVLVRVNRDGTVQLEAPTVETGPGSNTVCVATCADALGVRMEDVRWSPDVDTEVSLRDTPQTGSRVSHILPEAIRVVAGEAKDKLKALAAPEFGVGADGLDIQDGVIFVKGDPDEGILVADILGRRDGVPIVACGTHYLPTDMTGAPYVAAFAEVEVDTETGFVDVLRLVIVNDCGTIMYPTGAESRADRGAGHEPRRGPDRGDRLRPAHGHTLELQLDRLQESPPWPTCPTWSPSSWRYGRGQGTTAPAAWASPS